MEDLDSKKLKELNEAFKEKYKDVIKNIAINRNVDLGIGMDMLKAIARVELDPKLKDDENYVDYSENVEIDKEELKADYAEILELSEKIHKEKGLN